MTIDPSNHHNAALCPYCNAQGLKFVEAPESPAMARDIGLLERFAAELKLVAEHNADAVNWGGPTIRKQFSMNDGDMVRAAEALTRLIAVYRNPELAIAERDAFERALQNLNSVRRVSERDKQPVPHWTILEACAAVEPSLIDGSDPA